MDQSNELTTAIEREVSPMVATATQLVIKDSTTLTEATSMLSQLNTYQDKITEEKERVTKPLNEALKAERSRWKPMETTLTTAIDLIRGKMTTYQTKVTQEAKAAQDAVASLVASPADISTATEMLSEISTPDKKIITDDRSLTFRPTSTLKITSPLDVPREYLIVDEKRTLDDLKAGKHIAGCEIEIIQVPINRRK